MLFQSKQLDLHFTIGEALVFAAQGPTSPVARDLWTETEDEFKVITNSLPHPHTISNCHFLLTYYS